MIKKWKALVIIIVILALIGTFGLIGQQQIQEIRIGQIAPLSGDLKESGQLGMEGGKLAVDLVNEQGGLEVNGEKYKISLYIEDSKGSPEGAVSAAQNLINQKKVVAIIGPQFSTNAIPASEIAEQSMVPMIGATTTNPKVTEGKRYVFRIPFIDTFQGKTLAHFSFEDLNARKAAVLYDVADEFSSGIADVFKNEFESAGGQVAAFESYTSDEKNFTPYLENIMEKDAEIVLLPNYPDALRLQLQQIKDMNINITILGADTFNNLVSEFDSDIYKGLFYTFGFASELANEKTEAFFKDYNERYGKEAEGNALFTYEGFGVLFQAIKNQGKTDSESIRNGLAELGRYTGVTGTMVYSGVGDPERSIVILQVQEGKPVLYKIVNP